MSFVCLLSNLKHFLVSLCLLMFEIKGKQACVHIAIVSDSLTEVAQNNIQVLLPTNHLLFVGSSDALMGGHHLSAIRETQKAVGIFEQVDVALPSEGCSTGSHRCSHIGSLGYQLLNAKSPTAAERSVKVQV